VQGLTEVDRAVTMPGQGKTDPGVHHGGAKTLSMTLTGVAVKKCSITASELTGTIHKSAGRAPLD